MKNLPLIGLLSVTSILIMAAVDYFLGQQAEFLNAYSVFERLTCQEPAAGESLIARRLGATGELTAVLILNIFIGTILALLIKRFVVSRTGAK